MPTATAQTWPSSATVEGEITQQITRETLADNRDRVRGEVRVQFSPTHQLALAHVGFCPPLARMPSVEVRQTEGPPATVKPTQVLLYGVRFDVRLRESPRSEETVRITFTAVT